MSSKFKPGDRVIYTEWGHPSEGIGGTVIEVSVHSYSRAKSGINYYLLVILDTAEEILDEHVCFYLEDEYDPQIPF